MSTASTAASGSPQPGRPVRGSTTGRPIMALFDLLGRRWILRIVWELQQANEPPTFRELRLACSDISSSVLTRRLSDLTDALIVTHTGAGYALTRSGEDLVTSMAPLLHWSSSWAQRMDRSPPHGDNPEQARHSLMP